MASDVAVCWAITTSSVCLTSTNVTAAHVLMVDHVLMELISMLFFCLHFKFNKHNEKLDIGYKKEPRNSLVEINLFDHISDKIIDRYILFYFSQSFIKVNNFNKCSY